MDTKDNSKYDKLFISPKEIFVCALGEKQAEDYLESGSLKSGFAVLTDKRLYVKGDCYSRKNQSFAKTREDKVIDAEDVTGSNFVNYKTIARVFFLAPIIVAVILVAATVVIGIFDGIQDNIGAIVFFAVSMSALIALCWWLHYTYSSLFFEITFSGGSVMFSGRWFNEQELKDFHENLLLLKDAHEQVRNEERVEQEKEHLTDGVSEDPVGQKFKKQFMNPSENFAYALGRQYAEEHLASGVLTKGFAVLSDKRVYIKGKCFERNAQLSYIPNAVCVRRVNDDRIINIDDVTGAKIIYTYPFKLLIGAIIFTVLTAVVALMPVLIGLFGYEFNDSRIAFVIVGAALLAAIGIQYVIAFFTSHSSVFEITYSSSSVFMSTSWLNLLDIHEFQKNLHRLKSADKTEGDGQSKLFYEASENLICEIGSVEREQFLDNGTLGQGFVTLSNERLYIKGDCYLRKNNPYGGIEKTRVDKVIDASNVTDAAHVYHKTLLMLVAMILFSLAFVVFSVYILYQEVSQDFFGLMVFFLIFMPISLTYFWLLYAQKRKPYFEITFSDGSNSILFDLSKVDESEVREFRNKLLLFKESSNQ